jgi:ubiquitin C-terminal hydrolase
MKGLKNLGSTCFISSILQVLFNLEELRQALIEQEDKTSEFKTLMTHYHDQNELGVSVDALKQFILSTKLFFGEQGDQHEFFSGLLNIIHEAHYRKIEITMPDVLEPLMKKALTAYHLTGMTIDSDMNLKGKPYGYVSPITAIFTGQLMASTVCLCGAVSNNFEMFRTVELPLDTKGSSTLEACLANFTDLEHIDEFACDVCGKYQNAVRRFSFWKLPGVLSFTLKRYNHLLQKNNVVLKAPEILDLSPYLTRSTKADYALVAVAHHAGHPSFGHCFSTVKKTDNTWLVLNDEHVALLPTRSDSATDYMYFYKRIV